MIGISIAFGILAGSIDGSIEGSWINARTKAGEPALTPKDHLFLWLTRGGIIAAFTVAIWLIYGLHGWQPLWVVLAVGGLWAPWHRAALNIVRRQDYPSLPWWYMSWSGYDALWHLLGMWHYMAPFLLATAAEIAVAVFAIFKLT